MKIGQQVMNKYFGYPVLIKLNICLSCSSVTDYLFELDDFCFDCTDSCPTGAGI